MNKIGKYSIVGELGRGAMGIIYMGLDPYIGRTVAIKTIRFDVLSQPSDEIRVQERFMREARSAGNLSHPNIVTIYEVGEDQGLTYIAMEYIEGQSLEELLQSRRRFSLEEIINLMSQIGEALDYAHRKGVIHRDIKPANILVDKEGKPHIVDFGIARISASTMTQTRMVMGTPFYMSPEQISGKKVDSRADIFSLGAVLYEMLTNQKPFPGESITTVIYKIMNEHPPQVRTFSKSLPESLDHIVRRALAKIPESRYQTCRELSEDLSNYQRYEGLPLPVVLPSEMEAPKEIPFEEPQAVMPKGKNRRPLLLVLASMMAVLLIIIVAAVFYLRENKSIARLEPSSIPPPQMENQPNPLAAQPPPGEQPQITQPQLHPSTPQTAPTAQPSKPSVVPSEPQPAQQLPTPSEPQPSQPNPTPSEPQPNPPTPTPQETPPTPPDERFGKDQNPVIPPAPPPKKEIQRPTPPAPLMSQRDFEKAASNAYKSKDVQRLRLIIQEGLNLYPNSAELWGTKAAYHVTSDKSPERNGLALEAAQKALELDLSNPIRYINLGWIYQELLRDFSTALYYYEQGEVYAESQPELYYYMGICYEEVGSIQDAISCYERFLRMAPNHKLAQDARERLARLT